MVGAAAACLLSRAGFSVSLLDPGPPPQFDADDAVGLRVSALSPGSVNVLRECGAWRLIEKSRHCPFQRMEVEDQDDQSVLEFNSAEFGLDRLGTLVENDLVLASLWRVLETSAGVELRSPESLQEIERKENAWSVRTSSGSTLEAGLLIAADGADSAVRKQLGIRQKQWEYGQRGIVAVVRTGRPNPGIAWQRFDEGGPLAFLPLADGDSSIVWSRPEAEARRLMNLSDEAFAGELEAATQSLREAPSSRWLQSVQSLGPRASFPLTMRLSENYDVEGAVLIGDAAHVVHPLAGQGVNLGFQDVAALVQVLLEKRSGDSAFPDRRALRNYGRWRRSEASLMAGGIHGIRTLFNPPEIRPLRKFGVDLVNRSWTLKEAFIKSAAGLDRGSPAICRGEKLAHLMRSGQVN